MLINSTKKKLLKSVSQEGLQKDFASPLISIATVVRNGASTLEETIKSVSEQTFLDFEYIVIDGCSSDGTLDIIKRYSHFISTWISEADKGIYDAMNKALALANGRWLLFLGSDDTLISKEVLSKIAVLLNDEQSVYYGDVILKSSGRRYGGKMNTYKFMQQNICHQAVFYPRNIYKKKAYDLHSGLLADYRYNIELWGNSVSFHYIPLAVSLYADCGASSRPDNVFESIRLILIDRHFGWIWGQIKRIRNGLVKVKNFF